MLSIVFPVPRSIPRRTTSGTTFTRYGTRKRYLEMILAYTATNKRPPSIRELAFMAGKSHSAAQFMLDTLERKGLIARHRLEGRRRTDRAVAVTAAGRVYIDEGDGHGR